MLEVECKGECVDIFVGEFQ